MRSPPARARADYVFKDHKHWEALWTCIEHAGVELTNNAAERALRPAGLWRTGWYGTQSASGSRFVERMLLVWHTECEREPLR